MVGGDVLEWRLDSADRTFSRSIRKTDWMKTHFQRALVSFLFLQACSPAKEIEPANVTQEPTRREFARQMARVTVGMAEDDVIELLGKPSDVRSAEELRTRNIHSWTPRILCWGTNGHLTTATLGSVFIDRVGKVFFAVGGSGNPPPDSALQESRLRELLRILDRTPSFENWGNYDPRGVIQAVNALQPLGKELAIIVIREYLRVTPLLYGSDGQNGLFLAIRTLFEVPKDPGYMPRMEVGACSEEPRNRMVFPRFPIALIADIPILLAKGYSGVGKPESVEQHLTYFEKHGTIRAQPLRPTTSLSGALQECERAVGRLEAADSARLDLRFIARQLLTLCETVYRAAPRMTYEEIRSSLADIEKLRIRWDPVANRFTYPDGTVLNDF